MRILLIKPQWFVHEGPYRYLEHVRFTPLSLGILAALSDGHDVRILDGDWDAIPAEERFDLVGITATTFTSERVYGLAEQFARNGAKVILGGVHPTLLPKECLEHAHAVVVGEAEYLWKTILQDAESGHLERVYTAPFPTDMNDVPFPRRDLLTEPTWFACLQATRGCPNACRYCYLPSMPWHGYRKRAPELVGEELHRLKQKMVFFVDDNLFADRAYAMRIFRTVSAYRKTFAVQMPTNVGSDEELLDAMAQAGCFNVQVGFQSANPQSLEWAHVAHNRVENYRALVARLHARGILVTGFFILGFDTDDLDSFDRTTRMIRHIEVDEAHLYILTPYPGTSLYAQLGQEGRLLPAGRNRFGWDHAVFQPKLMTGEQLEQGVQRMYDDLNPWLLRRTARMFIKRLDLLARHPALLRVFASGAVRRPRIAGRRLDGGLRPRRGRAEDLESCLQAGRQGE
jgi:radical SAM superfamily enzyme YgiQ (UPF0313 family)